MKPSRKKIAIVGGGVAGSTAALCLSKKGFNVDLYEKKTSLIDGPPFCHLHAGGNLYREISDEQCITLLHQSIEFAKFYPYCVDHRPTVITIPTYDDGNPEDLLARLEKLQKEYESLIQEDKTNQVLGKSAEYFKLYYEKDIKQLQKNEITNKPKTLDEWMIPVAKNLDFEKIKFPLVIVQEYGLNLFKLASGLTLSLQKISNCNLYLETEVKSIQKTNNSWELVFNKNGNHQKETYDYLINAAGFLSGTIDDMLQLKRKRFVEFKAAYVTKWNEIDGLWPEVIFHGKRGTPNGMGQFTPYANGYIQLHGMTEEITLFKDGLVKSCEKSSQPKLGKDFELRLTPKWPQKEIEKRTQLAIDLIAKFIPKFKNSKVSPKPLWGAQQIPGNDKDLRAFDVSFDDTNYARCEIVKVSSVFTMVESLIKDLEKSFKLETIDKNCTNTINLEAKEIEEFSTVICKSRNYPEDLANVINPFE